MEKNSGGKIILLKNKQCSNFASFFAFLIRFPRRDALGARVHSGTALPREFEWKLLRNPNELRMLTMNLISVRITSGDGAPTIIKVKLLDSGNALPKSHSSMGSNGENPLRINRKHLFRDATGRTTRLSRQQAFSVLCLCSD